MTHRLETITPQFVESFPAAMHPGVLYVSIEYRTCGHLCCCGCGQEVVTPLSPAQWSLTYDGETVSLAPSVGNWALPCQSHYWIRRGRVQWSSTMSPTKIAAARSADTIDLQRHVSAGARRPWWRRFGRTT
jgi:hypothetical protein